MYKIISERMKRFNEYLKSDESIAYNYLNNIALIMNIGNVFKASDITEEYILHLCDAVDHFMGFDDKKTYDILKNTDEMYQNVFGGYDKRIDKRFNEVFTRFVKRDIQKTNSVILQNMM
jgi:hypothetical protein